MIDEKRIGVPRVFIVDAVCRAIVWRDNLRKGGDPMKRLAGILGSFALLATVASTLPAQAAETLVAGTMVQVRLLQPLSSSTASAGQEFPVEVTEQVAINNHIVIQKGARGIGKVVNVTRASGKSPGQITIQIKQISAVDGTPVPVSTYTKHEQGYEYGKAHTAAVVGTVLTGPFGLLFHNMVKGKDVTIPTSQTLPAYVQDAVAVEPH